MTPLTELRAFVRAAGARLKREDDLAAFEVYASASEQIVARLGYTSDLPSRGLEEFKALAATGFALRIVLRRDPHAIGNAAIAGDLSLEAAGAALERARRSTIVDPHFPGLPSAPPKLTAPPSAAGDLMRVGNGALASVAWEIIAGAVRAMPASGNSLGNSPGLVVGGDVSVMRDRMVIGNSAFTDLRSDQNAHYAASVTALIESLEAKGTATALGRSLRELRAASPRLGRAAVRRALTMRGGERPPPGTYRILLGAQPVAELLNYMVMPSLTTGAFHAASSAYHGRFGALVMDPRLSLADEPRLREGPVQRRVTCEGLAAARSELVREGRLSGLLSNFYDTRRLLNDPLRAEKLGLEAAGALDFPPASGYRLGDGATRHFDAHPGATGTNVVMRAGGGVGEKELIAAVGDGIYAGRVWYTYPINGQRAGDFTCTISGDSYVIRGGRLAAPLAPNCLRINANIAQVFGRLIAVGRRSEPAIVWGAPETYFVPSLVVDGLSLSAVREAHPG